MTRRRAHVLQLCTSLRPPLRLGTARRRSVRSTQLDVATGVRHSSPHKWHALRLTCACDAWPEALVRQRRLRALARRADRPASAHTLLSAPTSTLPAQRSVSRARAVSPCRVRTRPRPKRLSRYGELGRVHGVLFATAFRNLRLGDPARVALPRWFPPDGRITPKCVDALHWLRDAFHPHRAAWRRMGHRSHCCCVEGLWGAVHARRNES